MESKNPQQKPSSAETTKRPSGSKLVLILKMAAAANVEISEQTQEVYLEQLSTCSQEDLEWAATRTIREWDKPNMMPPLAFILARFPRNDAVSAEASFATLQEIIYRDWHPDIGWSRHVEIPPAMEYAIRQCGGLRRIHDIPEDSFPWLRKEYIAAHQRFVEEGGTQNYLSDKQAKQIFGQLSDALTKQVS